MLRVLLLVLLLANALVWAWTQGWLAPALTAPDMAEREPRRVAAQVNPELVTVLPDAAASAAVQAVRAAGTRCVEAGPFSEAEAGAPEAAMAAADLPAGSWQREVVAAPGAWLVFAGRYADAGARANRAAELRRLKLGFETLSEPAELAPGFVLSRHASREAADKALAALRNTPLREVRVVGLPAGPAQVWLRVPRADAALRARLQVVAANDPALAASGFKACAAAP